MLKNITQFKSVINEIENTFHFDANCPIDIAKQSMFDCLKWLGQIEDQIKAAQEAQKAQVEQSEEKKEVTDGQSAVESEPSV